jgi:predicted metal-dependent enzyme (double-stranded beta helix superfamily)
MITPAQFIEKCKSAVESAASTGEIAALVEEALASQVSDPAAWDVDELMYRADNLLIVNLTLPPHATSPVHDHGTWAVIGIAQGCEIEHFYEERAGRLIKTGEAEVTAGHAICLGADTIHAISNPMATPARGIHVYGRDLVVAPRHMWRPETGERMPFDMKTFEEWEKELTARSSAVT